MSCLNLQGYDKGCDENGVGGVSKITLFELADVSTFTIDPSGLLTELELTTEGNAFNYDFQYENANTADVPVGGDKIAISYQPTINMIFNGYSISLVNEVIELAKNRLVAIVEFENGEYKTFGLEKGLRVNASAGNTSGNSITEQNQTAVLLQGSEKRPVVPTDISGTSLVDAKILALFGF